uniref:Putative transcriptional regulatory protein PB1A11.04c n=1 Tax=Talaromyces marneffei PM1 TaxID=1077442 RepID=A0A093XPT8_TALMA
MSLDSQSRTVGKRRQQQQIDGDGDSIPGSERKRPRTLQACLPCRRRKVKCNGAKPRCHNCARFDDECQWPSGNVSSGQVNVPLMISPLGAHEFLSGDQALCLSKAFFSSPQFSLVGHAFHRPTFEGRQFLEQPLLLRVAICSLAALQLADDDLERYFSREDGPDVSNRLALIGQTLSRDSSFHPTVENILANALLGWRELIAGSGNLAWLYTGLAIRMAQVLRLGKEYHQRHPAVERERRRRAMWTAFILDRLVSYVMARPQAIGVHKLRIQLPCPNHHYVFGEAYSGPNIHQPLLGEVSNDDILAYVIRVINLWGGCTDLFANLAIGETSSSAQFEIELRQMELTIETWTAQLPDRLHWSPENYASHKLLGIGSQFILLQMLILHIQCTTQHGFLPFETLFVSESGRDSAAVQSCLAYAQRITEIATLLFQGDDVDRANLTSPFSGIAIACAANVWIWRVHVNDMSQIEGAETSSDTDQEIKSYLASIIAILKSWAKTWKLAQSWLDVIGILTQYYATIYTGNSAINLGEQELGHEGRSTEQDPDQEVEIGSGFPEPPDFQDLFRRIYFLNAAVGESSTLRRQFARFQNHSSWTQIWLGSLLSSQALDDHLAGFDQDAGLL